MALTLNSDVMKKLIYILAFSVFCLVSCNDFLNKTPYDSIGTESELSSIQIHDTEGTVLLRSKTKKVEVKHQLLQLVEENDGMNYFIN